MCRYDVGYNATWPRPGCGKTRFVVWKTFYMVGEFAAMWDPPGPECDCEENLMRWHYWECDVNGTYRSQIMSFCPECLKQKRRAMRAYYPDGPQSIPPLVMRAFDEKYGKGSKTILPTRNIKPKSGRGFIQYINTRTGLPIHPNDPDSERLTPMPTDHETTPKPPDGSKPPPGRQYLPEAARFDDRRSFQHLESSEDSDASDRLVQDAVQFTKETWEEWQSFTQDIAYSRRVDAQYVDSVFGRRVDPIESEGEDVAEGSTESEMGDVTDDESIATTTSAVDLPMRRLRIGEPQAVNPAPLDPRDEAEDMYDDPRDEAEDMSEYNSDGSTSTERALGHGGRAQVREAFDGGGPPSASEPSESDRSEDCSEDLSEHDLAPQPSQRTVVRRGRESRGSLSRGGSRDRYIGRRGRYGR